AGGFSGGLGAGINLDRPDLHANSELAQVGLSVGIDSTYIHCCSYYISSSNTAGVSSGLPDSLPSVTHRAIGESPISGGVLSSSHASF
ncbi:hypothetical protein BaRGS_00011249, partial [Batillaria attramentaria]